MPPLKQTLHDEPSCCMVKAPCAHLLALRRRLQTRGQEEMAATRAKVQEFAEQSASLEQAVKQKEAHIKALQVCLPAQRASVLLSGTKSHNAAVLEAFPCRCQGHMLAPRSVGEAVSAAARALPSGTPASVQHVLQADCRPRKHSTAACGPPRICMHHYFYGPCSLHRQQPDSSRLSICAVCTTN